jgi:pyruvate/2-oxoglutarate dehydrogenase complex dihydrolipoamide dehydrogenase (E3) component
MAQSFARFGSAVWLVEALHGVLPREDRDAAAVIEKALRQSGVQLLCCGQDLAVSQAPEGIRLKIASHAQRYDLIVNEVLVAAGRTPNLEGLGLERVGVEFDGKGVRVNDHLQTSNRHIYACGDVCSPYQFTHAADFMARAVIQNAFFGFAGKKRVSRMTIPWCTYTDPEIAHVGLYERDAQERGIEVDTFTVPMSEVDRAIAEGDEGGFVKIHVRKGSDEILGSTVVSRHAGETISEITTAMAAKLGLGRLASVIHPYPTQAEAIRKAGDAFNRTRLTPGRANLLRKYFEWRRRS